MTLSLSSDGQTLTGVLAGGYGTVVFTKVSTVSSGGIYAFGDSIAAGYGMPGLSNGTGDDNPYAYPALLAQSLGVPYHNFASAGACADPSDAVDPLSQSIKQADNSMGYCNTLGVGQLPLTDQIANAPLTPLPSLVTVTIGANDIDFQNCIQAVVLGAYNDPRQDPCEPTTNLPANLQALGGSLKSDLTTLQSVYPGVPILVTGYYNPFPSGSEPLCNFDAAVGTWLYIKNYLDHDPRGLLRGLRNILIRPDAFLAGLQTVQGAIYSRATYVLDHLNSTLSSTAGSLSGVSFAPVNFTGHDFCQAQNAWIFGPNISASLSINFGGSTHTLTFNASPQVCPNPTVLEQTYPLINPSLPLPGRNSATFNLSLSTNCMPHPTQTGQQQLASQISSVASQFLSATSSPRAKLKPQMLPHRGSPHRSITRTKIHQRLAA
jgi:lysophospholipase L1-like esterase